MAEFDISHSIFEYERGPVPCVVLITDDTAASKEIELELGKRKVIFHVSSIEDNPSDDFPTPSLYFPDEEPQRRLLKGYGAIHRDFLSRFIEVEVAG
jgi:hypothetical protein